MSPNGFVEKPKTDEISDLPKSAPTEEDAEADNAHIRLADEEAKSVGSEDTRKEGGEVKMTEFEPASAAGDKVAESEVEVHNGEVVEIQIEEPEGQKVETESPEISIQAEAEEVESNPGKFDFL